MYSGYTQKLDSLKAVTSTLEKNEDLVKLHLDISKIYARIDHDSSYYYAEKALKYSIDINDLQGEGSALKRLGTLNFYLGNYKKADSLYKKASSIFLKTNDSLNYAFILSDIGDIFKAKGENDKAVHHYIKAHSLLKILKDESGSAIILNKLAGLYYSLKHYQKAIEHYNLALEIVIKDNYLPAISALYINIGNVYSDLFEEEIDSVKQKEHLEIADSYYQKALVIKREIRDLKGTATCLINIGLNKTRKKDFESAIAFFLEAIEISKQINNPENLYKAYQNLAHTYTVLNDYHKALSYAELVYMAKKTSGFDLSIQIKSKNHFILAEIYKNINKPKEALFHYESYMKLNDSIFNREKIKIINETEGKYQSKIKEQENKILTNENAIHKLKLQKNKTQLFILTITLILAVLSILSILLFIRQKRLRNKQSIILLEQRLLRSQMNPHFIFNSLVAIQSFILKSKPEEGAMYLSKFASLIRLVLQHSRTEYVPIEKEIEALRYYLDLQKLRYDNSFQYEIFEDDTIFSEYYLIPPMLAQPFIENAIEHGIAPLQKQGLIKIFFERKNDQHLEFRVEDNGVGFNRNKEEDSVHYSLATKITKERLTILNRNKRKKIKLEVKERKNTFSEIEGVTTIFNIPFIYKY